MSWNNESLGLSESERLLESTQQFNGRVKEEGEPAQLRYDKERLIILSLKTDPRMPWNRENYSTYESIKWRLKEKVGYVGDRILYFLNRGNFQLHPPGYYKYDHQLYKSNPDLYFDIMMNLQKDPK